MPEKTYNISDVDIKKLISDIKSEALNKKISIKRAIETEEDLKTYSSILGFYVMIKNKMIDENTFLSLLNKTMQSYKLYLIDEREGNLQNETLKRIIKQHVDYIR
jgi:hypothetical protein